MARKQKAVQTIEFTKNSGLSIGDLLVDSKKSKISARAFLARRSFLKSKQEEAKRLIIDHYNGEQVNFGFKKPVQSRSVKVE